MGGTFIMDKCPFCGAETRPGDNFCLNCGNRLLPANSSPQQGQPVIGDSTLPAQEDWAQSLQGPGAAPVSSNPGWLSDATIASTNVEPANIRSEAPITSGEP